MKLRTPCLTLALALLLPALATAQVPPDRVLSTFSISRGLELTLWASEPLAVNPTCIDIDHRGRVWLCESVNYRCKLRHQPLRRKEGDRIIILEDTDADGKADKSSVFYQNPALLAPLGIAVAKDPRGPGYKVFVCQSPDILLFEDKEGDGKADGPPRKFLTGFQGIDHDHGVHGILLGPDGKLYFSVGDQGVRNLQGADGKGRRWSSNETDVRAGTVWRCDLDGGNLQLIAHNFRNEYEPAVDSFGTVFVSDNDDDGNRMTRICYVMPGGNYGYHPRGRGQSHWHEEQPGVVPMILRTYFGSPTGMCFYEGTLLPKPYQGQPLHTDAGPRNLRCYHLTPKGASYAVDREDIITSTDNWFRASDVCVAPDGSVFVADWYDPGVGGHGIGDFTRGRIYRVVPRGHKGCKVPKVNLKTPEGIRAALASPALSVRYMAIAALRDMPAGEASEVLQPALSQKDNPFLRARALWQLNRPDVPTASLRALGSKVIRDSDDPRFAVQALRMLKDRGISPADLDPITRRKITDTDTPAMVRREALLLLRDAPPKKAKGMIYDLAKLHDGKDRFYLAAVGIAVGRHDASRRETILKDFGKQFPAFNDAVLDLAWELQPPGALSILGERLTDAKVPARQRARIVDILAASEDPNAGKNLLNALRRGLPEDVRDRVIDNLKTYLPTRWASLRTSKELDETVKSLLSRADTRTTALALIGAAQKRNALRDVLGLARGKDVPVEVRQAAIRTLGELSGPRSVEALAELTGSAPANLQPEAVAALGQMLGSRRRGPTGEAALKALEKILEGKKHARAVQAAAVEALAGNRDGTAWLLALHARGGLAKELQADAGRLLRNTPYRDLRARAHRAFPAPGKLDPKKLPTVASLLARKGNAERGRQLLAASAKSDLQCLKCHTVRGVGGQIGPDLSVIGKKGSRENLFDSVLDPSKAIADQYVTWQIETRKGLVLVGLLVEETPDYVTLRDGNGKDQRIARKDIQEKIKSPKSLMPDDLLAFMTEDDLVDLVAYLATLQTPALNVPSWHIVGPFPNGTGDAGMNRAFGPEKGVDLKASYQGKSGKVSWKTVSPDATGYVDLRAFYAAQPDQIVSYLYREIDSPAEQDATVLLGADDCSKLWINGKLVHTDGGHRAAEPGQFKLEVRLHKGTNRVLLKINNGNGAHGFFFTLLAEQEVKLAGK
jgi:putative membrane-bound dehydrogenase-like protein